MKFDRCLACNDFIRADYQAPLETSSSFHLGWSFNEITALRSRSPFLHVGKVIHRDVDTLRMYERYSPGERDLQRKFPTHVYSECWRLISITLHIFFLIICFLFLIVHLLCIKNAAMQKIYTKLWKNKIKKLTKDFVCRVTDIYKHFYPIEKCSRLSLTVLFVPGLYRANVLNCSIS